MDYYLAILTFTFVAGITPGPNNIMLVASGANHGIKKSLPHYLGVSFGFPVMVAFMGFGLGALFEKYPQIHDIIKTLGIAYLLFLAWKIATATNAKKLKKSDKPITFFQAALFQWVNPKAWVVGAGALATYTIPEKVTESIIIIIIAYILMGLLTMGIWLAFGVGLQNWLNNEKKIKRFNISMATLLVISIIPMVT